MARGPENEEAAGRVRTLLSTAIQKTRSGLPAPSVFDPFRIEPDGRLIFPDGTVVEPKQEVKREAKS